MSKKEKLIARFKTCPADFSWGELQSLLNHLGFSEQQGDGSRVKFYNPMLDCLIHLHKPHPIRHLKRYMIKEILELLMRMDLV